MSTAEIGTKISYLKDTFEACGDIVFKPVEINNNTGFLIFLSEMIDHKALFEIEQGFFSYKYEQMQGKDIRSIVRERYPFSSVLESDDTKSMINEILSGRTVLLFKELDIVFSFVTTNSTSRRIDEPRTERTVRGPQEAFIESIDTNLMLIRRKVRTPSLKVEYLTLGKQTNTKIAVVFLKGIANDDIVKEVHQRLNRIEIDGVLESQYIESMIKDSPKSPFPTVYSTERPDKVSADLLEGKVAIFIDGTPFVLTAPALFVEFLHSSEDYYDGSLVATTIRWIRFLGLFVTLILPSFYVAMVSVHQDLLQTPLLLRLAANREALPYPVLVEGIFLILTYELIREAGLRMPKPLGGAIVTILGLVLIGQATVQAGIIGPVMAIVVSVTALTSFILPNYAFHQIIRYCGIPILLLAGFFGFMGILVALMFGLAHLVNLRSFGVPYSSPVSPAQREGWKDVFIRAPWWAIETRTPGVAVENVRRAGFNNYPQKPNNNDEQGGSHK
ncbi:spore germination protein [Alkalihalobacillus sp. AL-G]|uniref:spore germination protein n=1 Tax=Alkalihalobacillus sp. AL-G TaxID=2926399 RepID=UPI00272B7393|nr:spore germination protein [Alkalihalobacillus sp. AL-G]WLD93758.1 spore germination protein [Alkalihalobacillus sp. AL-G]